MKPNENRNRKLTEINEDELVEATGGKEDFTIKPPKDAEFWHSWNPSSFISEEEIINKR